MSRIDEIEKQLAWADKRPWRVSDIIVAPGDLRYLLDEIARLRAELELAGKVVQAARVHARDCNNLYPTAPLFLNLKAYDAVRRKP